MTDQTPIRLHPLIIRSMSPLPPWCQHPDDFGRCSRLPSRRFGAAFRD